MCYPLTPVDTHEETVIWHFQQQIKTYRWIDIQKEWTSGKVNEDGNSQFSISTKVYNDFVYTI